MAASATSAALSVWVVSSMYLTAACEVGNSGMKSTTCGAGRFGMNSTRPVRIDSGAQPAPVSNSVARIGTSRVDIGPADMLPRW